MLRVATLFRKWPYVLDAAAQVIQQGGREAISAWSLVRTGARSKSWYLKPEIGLAILLSAAWKWLQVSVGLQAAIEPRFRSRQQCILRRKQK